MLRLNTSRSSLVRQSLQSPVLSRQGIQFSRVSESLMHVIRLLHTNEFIIANNELFTSNLSFTSFLVIFIVLRDFYSYLCT